MRAWHSCSSISVSVFSEQVVTLASSQDMHMNMEGNLLKTYPDFRSSHPNVPFRFIPPPTSLKLDTTLCILVVAFYHRVHELEVRLWIFARVGIKHRRQYLGLVQTYIGSMIFYGSIIVEPNTAMPRTPQRSHYIARCQNREQFSGRLFAAFKHSALVTALQFHQQLLP
ncbi:hypothetical protein BD769DRAFT_69462 [Suillus cothurnatus]|nr:hypothetical protein BD769DRAFT_69462 [Suillus cothurnatus]